MAPTPQELTALAREGSPEAIMILQDQWEELRRPDVADIWRSRPRAPITLDQAEAWVKEQTLTYAMSTMPGDRPLFEAAICGIYHLLHRDAPQIIWASNLVAMCRYSDPKYWQVLSDLNVLLDGIERVVRDNSTWTYSAWRNLWDNRLKPWLLIISDLNSTGRSLVFRSPISSAAPVLVERLISAYQPVEEHWNAIPPDIQTLYIHASDHIKDGQFGILAIAAVSTLQAMGVNVSNEVGYAIKCLLAICRSACFWLPLPDKVIVCERPRRIDFNARSPFRIEWEGLVM